MYNSKKRLICLLGCSFHYLSFVLLESSRDYSATLSFLRFCSYLVLGLSCYSMRFFLYLLCLTNHLVLLKYK